MLTLLLMWLYPNSCGLWCPNASGTLGFCWLGLAPSLYIGHKVLSVEISISIVPTYLRLSSNYPSTWRSTTAGGRENVRPIIRLAVISRRTMRADHVNKGRRMLLAVRHLSQVFDKTPSRTGPKWATSRRRVKIALARRIFHLLDPSSCVNLRHLG